METMLKGITRVVVIGPQRPTVLIGERINPTGRKRLTAALQSGDLTLVREEALAQVAAGADVIDINVGAAGVDQMRLLPQAVRVVMEAVDVPVALDTASIEALAAALATVREVSPQGKPLVNSVNGEESRLRAVLPLVREYGAAVIGLCMDDEGIPNDPARRVAIARKIVEQAEAAGVPTQDVLIDCLALTVGADHTAGYVTLEAIRRVREELGVNMTLGASNISFGLPEREVINQAFLPMAILAGITSAIVDADRVRFAVLAADLLLGRDPHAGRYLRAYRQRKAAMAGR